MRTARIIEVDRKTTQSGKAKAGRWVLELEREQPLRPDPQTGGSGSGGTGTQLRIAFNSMDEAIAYATRKGLAFHLVPAAPTTLKIQTYADNFR